jgi:hypothetical protein
MKYILILIFVTSIAFADTNDLKRNVEKLSSEEFGGRKPGTPEIDKAADYIKEQFEEAGLEPLNETWFNEFTVKSGKKLEGENSLSFDIYIPRPGIPKDRLRPRTATWENLSDWTPMQFSSNGEYSGEMVFVGYGITSEDLGYDDYAGVDTEGKAVVIVGNSPDGESKTGEFSRYSSWRYKTSNAKDHGAAAIIFIKPQGDSANVLIPLDVENRLSTNAGIPAIQVSREKFIKYFPKSKGLLKLEKQINNEKKPASMLIENKEVSLKVNLTDIEFPARNVIGVLEGDSEDYIFIGAHYDHLGVSNSGSSRYRDSPPKMHPGADDNASGTAAIIEIAKRLKEIDTEHSVIFAAWSAEEMGLLGSAAYVKNDFNIKDKVKCYLNFDMVGRLKDSKLSILGVGSSPDFKNAIEQVSSNYAFDLNLIESGMGPSDHSSFYKEEKPVLAFFSGIHSDYHTPEDTPDKINYEGMDSIINFSIDLFKILDKKSEIAYSEVQMNEKAQKLRRGSSNVVMGVIPNYSDIDHGFIIDGVKPGGPAALAGLRGGDIITEVDGDKINDIYDFMYAYWDKNPGDEVIVKVLRDNKKEPVSLKVKLAAKDY